MRGLVLYFYVIGLLCADVILSEINTYRVGVIEIVKDTGKYGTYVTEASKSNVDILLLSSLADAVVDNNYEIIKSVSEAAKQSGVYVIAELSDTTRDDEEVPFIHSLVFDRNGNVVSVYKNSHNKNNKCNITTHQPSFPTDFEVTFHFVTAEDVVLNHPGKFSGQNIVIVGGLDSLGMVSSQYLASWAQHAGANAISSSAIFGKEFHCLTKNCDAKVHVAEMMKSPKIGQSLQLVHSIVSKPSTEDLNQYIIKPLDLEASNRGYKERVCHEEFCCEFYVKTGHEAEPSDVTYSFAVYNGHLNLYSNKVGVQTCAIVACSGHGKSSCIVGSQKTKDITFEQIVVSGNFSIENAIQTPSTISTTLTPLSNNHYTFHSWSNNNVKQVAVTLLKPTNLVTFGIFGRDFSMDFENSKLGIDGSLDFSVDLNEFFDYVWIRLRVPIFIVSIYVLEMM